MDYDAKQSLLENDFNNERHLEEDAHFSSNSGNDEDTDANFDGHFEPAYRNITVYVCSWNVNAKNLNFAIEDLLAFDSRALPELCVFGFQEVNSKPIRRLLDFIYNDPWTNELTNLLNSMNYVLLKSTRLVGILMNIYVKRSILPYVKYCSEEWVRLGFCGLWGNKGANICTINISGLNLCFVNSHLSAHLEREKARIKEHSKIMYHKLNLAGSSGTVSEQDYLFFFGDLNFRVENLTYQQVLDLIETKNYKELKNFDQLQRSLKTEECFSTLQEGSIDFAPTYKFKINTNSYECTMKNRLPSYCDRILFKINKNDAFVQCKPLRYFTLPQFSQSDHKPVCGLFDVKLLNWTAEELSVVFLDIKANAEQNLEIRYKVKRNVFTHTRDWIGLYHPRFKTSDNYVTWAWAKRIPEQELSQKLKNKKDSLIDDSYVEKKIEIDQYYVDSGFYVLGYFSCVANCLIGVSNIFELKLS